MNHTIADETPLHVMLVEDDPMQAEVFEAILDDAGYRVTRFEGGAPALAALKTGRYDVIVSDHDMPGMDGLTFLRRAGLLAPRTARVMLTATEEFDVVVGAINEGKVFRFLTKPVEPRRLQLLVTLANEHQKTQLVLAATQREARERDLLFDRVGKALVS